MTIESAWAQAGSMSWPSRVRAAPVERAQMKSFLGACAKHGTTAPTHAARTSAAIDPRFIRLLLRMSSRGIENLGWGGPARGRAHRAENDYRPCPHCQGPVITGRSTAPLDGSAGERFSAPAGRHDPAARPFGPQRATGAAYDEGGGQYLPERLPFAPPARAAQQALHGALAESIGIDMHRGERRVEVARHGDVVETGDGDVLRNAQPGVAQRSHHADRHVVVGREHRGRARVERQQALPGRVPRGLAEIARDLELLTPGAALAPHRAPVALEPLPSVDVALGPRDGGDARVPQRLQVPHHGARPVEVG